MTVTIEANMRGLAGWLPVSVELDKRFGVADVAGGRKVHIREPYILNTLCGNQMSRWMSVKVVLETNLCRRCWAIYKGGLVLRPVPPVPPAPA